MRRVLIAALLLIMAGGIISCEPTPARATTVAVR